MSKFQIKSENNGDIYFITTDDKEKLAKIGISICENLGEHIFNIEKAIAELLRGDEYRPGGCFGIKIRERKRENNEKKLSLMIDNRNGRWIETFTKQLKEAIEGVDELKEALAELKKSIKK